MVGCSMSRLAIISICILIASGCVNFQGDNEVISFVFADGAMLGGTLVFPESTASLVPVSRRLRRPDR